MKHKCKDKDVGKNLPLFNWECITIQLKRRDLDLVIKNELDMQILIKYLIVQLNTFDSNKNSIDFLKT